MTFLMQCGVGVAESKNPKQLTILPQNQEIQIFACKKVK